MKLKELLNEETLKVFSEDSIEAIEKALKQKVQLATEAALSQQDEEYAQKLSNLLETIDKDCTVKLKRVVEAIDKSSTKKLKLVVSRYEKLITEDAKKFKGKLVGSLSQFIDKYIDNAIPAEALNEAVRNKTATNVLRNLREVLSVNSALMKESVKGALQDGKAQLQTLQEQVAKLRKANRVLAEKTERTQAALVLEKKTAGMAPARKKHIMKTLGNKPLDYIQENFDYAKDLIVKNEKKSERKLQTEAFKKRKIQSDVVVEKKERQTPEEQVVNPYLQELQKLK
jgi:hypothetical protein